MALESFIWNCDDFAGWTTTNLSVASNQVFATTGGVSGNAYKLHGVPASEGVLSFDIIPDTTDTAGRFVWAGQFRQTLLQGYGVGYVAGTGIVIFSHYNGNVQNPITLVADGSVENGHRYHVEIYFAKGVPSVLSPGLAAQVYDMDDADEPALDGARMPITPTWPA